MTWVAFGLISTTYTWDKAYGRPCIVVSSEGLQMSAVPRADCREVVWSSLAAACVFVFAFAFASPSSLVPCRSTFGLGSKSRRTYDIVRWMTSLLISEGWASLC